MKKKLGLDLQVFLSRGLTAKNFHLRRSFSCQFLPYPGICIPTSCITHAVLTAPLESSTCPCQWSLFSFKMRSRSSSSKFATNGGHVLYGFWERSGSVVECLIWDRKAAGSRLTGVTALCPWARHINPCLVLVQPRKECPDITEQVIWVKNWVLVYFWIRDKMPSLSGII